MCNKELLAPFVSSLNQQKRRLMIKRIKQYFIKKQEERSQELHHRGYNNILRQYALGIPIDILREVYLKVMAESAVDENFSEGMRDALTYLANKPQKVDDIPHLTKQAQ